MDPVIICEYWIEIYVLHQAALSYYEKLYCLQSFLNIVYRIFVIKAALKVPRSMFLWT